ncbi:MAG TPA: helix-turn-helix domain-containing protein [Solirubrobacteraceae bacterium]|nr:helix-turn-helix domain-containing protein [Solirubrobacteraceae bacterium]
MSVNEAAGRLGVSPAAVRQRMASGRLPATKRGRSWWLDERVVQRHVRQPTPSGRPLSPSMAWAIILLASGDEAGAKRLAPRERYPSRMRAWLEGHPLGEHASKLRPRAAIEDLAGHRSELGRLLARPDVLVTGASAGDVVGLAGKVPGVEVYAPAGHRAAILSEHALTPASDGLIRIRWVRDELWPHLHQDRDRRTPRAAVLLDLLESDDPRARRESARALAS